MLSEQGNIAGHHFLVMFNDPYLSSVSTSIAYCFSIDLKGVTLFKGCPFILNWIQYHRTLNHKYGTSVVKDVLDSWMLTI